MSASAHRHWRLLISSTTTGTAAGFAELELRAYIGSSDLTGTGTVSASSQYDGVTYPATNAVDNNTATAWNSAISGADVGAWWWAYDFGAGNTYEIGELAITATGTSGGGTVAPSAFAFQYSDNGSSWTTLQSYSGLTWTDGQARTLIVNAVRDHIETTGAAEASAAGVQVGAAESEATGARDTGAAATSVGSGGSEATGAAEAQSSTQGYAVSQSDAAGVADYYVTALGLTGAASEAVGASESQAADLFSFAGTAHAMGQTESVGASDACAATLLRPATASTRPTAPPWWLRHRRPGRLWPS